MESTKVIFPIVSIGRVARSVELGSVWLRLRFGCDGHKFRDPEAIVAVHSCHAVILVSIGLRKTTLPKSLNVASLEPCILRGRGMSRWT